MENIVFITHHLSGIGGVQKFIQVLAKQFLEDGHSVDVIGISTPKGVEYKKASIIHEKYKEICLHKQDVFTTYPHKLFMDAYVTHKSAKEIQKIINGKKNPIIIIANPLSYLIIKDVDFSHAKITLGQMHSSAAFLFENKGMYKAYLYFVKKYYKYLDKFLFLTKADAIDAEKQLGWNNINYVENPLPFDLEHLEKASLTATNIVIVGRIDENKQVNHAIDAFSQILFKNPSWTLEIFGTGDKEQDLHEYIQQKNLQNHVLMKGFVSDVKEVFLQSSITLLTSKKEGIPMSAMESIACGVPVIAYNCSPGVAEIVGNSGELIPINDKNMLAQSLDELMNDFDKRIQLQQRGLEYIKKYDVKAVSKKWYSLFEKEEAE